MKKRSVGKPSPYEGRELEIATQVAERLRKGEPMAVILRSPGMPCFNAIEDWRAKDTEINSIIARAREEGFDAIAADCLSIADDGVNDTQVDDDGREIINNDVIQRSKLRVETRLKLLAKWCPKRYGEKLEVDQKLSGEIKHLHTVTETERKDLVERRRLALTGAN